MPLPEAWTRDKVATLNILAIASSPLAAGTLTPHLAPSTSATWPWLLSAGFEAGAVIAEAEWPGILDAAEAHGLLGALAARLRRSEGLQLPVAQAERCQAAYRRAVIGSLGMRALAETALDALARNDITPVGYKGVALAHLCYPDPAMRGMADIDLWLPEGRMQDAKAALYEAGFVHMPSRESRPEAWQAARGGEVQVEHPRLGLVELHYDVFPGEWLHRMAAIDRGAVVARLVPTRVLGRAMRVLAPRDHLVQVALHAGISNRHSLQGLRGLLDIALLADHVADWDAMCDDIRGWRIRRVMAHAFHLAGLVFERPRLREAAAVLAAGHSIAWLERHLDADGLLRGTRLDGSWRRWSYLLFAADRGSDAARLLARTVWPDRGWLALRYGEGGWSRRLDHLSNIVRGQV